MAKLVLLNLADPRSPPQIGQPPQTLVARSAAAIKQKPSFRRKGLSKLFSGNDTIEVVDLYELLADVKANRMPNAGEIAAAKAHCSSASKIMLCIHGVHNDTDWGLATVDTSNGGYTIGNFVRYDDLAAFVGPLLPTPKCNLALIMCYGARSASYEKNHEGALLADDLKSSFAYKFFKLLCPGRKLRMTARTGFTGFNEQNGHSEVCTEAAVTAEEDWRELQAADDTSVKKRASDMAFQHLQAEFAKTMKWGPAIDAASKQQRDLIDGTVAAVTADEIALRDYGLLKQRNDALNDQRKEVRTKYGKMIYVHDADTLTIYRKYPNMETLYQGAML